MAFSRSRTFFAFFILGALPPVIYLAASVAGAVALAEILNLGPGPTQALQVLGFLLGWSLTVISAFAFAPLLSRAAFRSSPVTQAETAIQIQQVFERAGAVVPVCAWVSLPGSDSCNAWVTGLKKPFLHLSANIRDRLDSEEFQAVLLHEVAHLRLGHLRSRAKFGLAFSFVGFPALLVASLWLGESVTIGQTRVALMSGMAWMVVFQWGMAWITRHQEFEADAVAVRELGADRDALISAFRKLRADLPSHAKKSFFQRLWDSHPSNARRAEALMMLDAPSAFRAYHRVLQVGVVLLLATGAVPLSLHLYRGVVLPELLRQAVLSGDFARTSSLIASGVDVARDLPLAPGVSVLAVAGAKRDPEMLEFIQSRASSSGGPRAGRVPSGSSP